VGLYARKACGVVLSEDPLIFICGGSLSVHGSAVIGPRLFRLLVVKLIGARGGAAYCTVSNSAP
jgi:hypothetical protein